MSVRVCEDVSVLEQANVTSMRYHVWIHDSSPCMILYKHTFTQTHMVALPSESNVRFTHITAVDRYLCSRDRNLATTAMFCVFCVSWSGALTDKHNAQPVIEDPKNCHKYVELGVKTHNYLQDTHQPNF